MKKIAYIIMLIGALLVTYNGYQYWKANQVIIKDKQLARSISNDWYNTKKHEGLREGVKSNILKRFGKGEKIGQLFIPKLGYISPIVLGTDDESLKGGVGLYEGYGTVKPGETGHVVLSGHRDTVFRGLDQLKQGDKVYVVYNNKKFTYQIRKYWRTNPDDRTVIVPISQPVLTLTTCYPFDYIGDAPERYIIRSELIKIEDYKKK